MCPISTFLFYCWLPCASAKHHLCNLVVFSVHSGQSMKKYSNKSQTALDADVFWVPKYFWCFKFCKLTVLKLRQSENWKQRWVNHAHKHTKPQLSNKIKSPNICWKNYFQLMLALSEEQLRCTVLVFWSCTSASASPEAWNHLSLGWLQLQQGQLLSKGEIPWNGPIWDVSLLSCFPHAWQVYSTGNYCMAGGAQPRDAPGAGSVHSLCGSAPHLLLLPFFPGTNPAAGLLQGHQFGWKRFKKPVTNITTCLQQVSREKFLLLSRGNWKGKDFGFV